MRSITVNPSKHDPQPAAIYVHATPRQFLAGTAYGSHRYGLKLYDKIQEFFFAYCHGCDYRRQGKCVGGRDILLQNSIRSISGTLPNGKTIYRPSMTQNCFKKLDGSIGDLGGRQNTVQVVKLPSYILWSRANAASETSLVPHWFVLNDNAQTFEDMWRGIPFAFGNVYSHGEMCMGSTRYTRDNLESIQRAILTGQFNTDLNYFLDRNLFTTLGQYANALTMADDQIAFLNQFVNSRYRDFQKPMFDIDVTASPTDRYRNLILPPIYDKIFWDSGNRHMYVREEATKQHFKIDVNNNLEPCELP